MASCMRSAVVQLLRAVTGASCSCPVHSQPYGPTRVLRPSVNVRRPHSSGEEKEYAFEMAMSSVRYGEGVTREVGCDVVNLGIKNLCVVTDRNLARLPPVQAVLDSLHQMEVSFTLYDNVSIEPTDESFFDAISFARKNQFDGFVAVGGGSVMDTAKVSNLFVCHPDNDFLDFVNAPIGKGIHVSKKLKPLICVPTTAGSSSENTGVAIFDYKPLQCKTGFSSHAIRPLLGIIDPLHLKHMPRNVATYSGFDVLCHSLESYTTLLYSERAPRPSDPSQRPLHQGRNPISDIWSREALQLMSKYFKRSVKDVEDQEAQSAVIMASMMTGVGLGNAGVHLPHAMSYAIAGLNKTFTSPGYDPSKPLVPHGLAVVLTAPAVFNFTSPACPERHLEAAEILGCDVTGVKLQDAGRILADTLKQYMSDLGICDGLKAIGYGTEHIPDLVKGTLPQKRATQLAPMKFTEDHLSSILENSLKVY